MTPATKGDPLALPFDQYQRYRLVADVLAQLRGRGRTPLEVLDVGGRTALLRRFLRRDKITLVDLEPSDERALVLGDGGHLPFQDRAFDVVTAFDTLEHVPPAQRRAFVAECRRVARKWVVLAGPYQSERVEQAEELLKRFLLEKLGLEHRYLNEHRAHGLPDRSAVAAQLEQLGGRVATIGHANLDRWLVLMCATMYMDADPALRDLAQAFSRFYNASLYASDHAEPVYRHLVVGAFEGAALPQAAKLLAPPVAPAGALAGFGEFTSALLAFDRERGEWQAERARLRKVAADLEQDLAGHRATLSGALAEARELARMKTELEVDLEGHRRTVTELELDLGGHRKRLAEELEEAARLRKVAREQEADLAGHRESLGAARAELQARAAALNDLELELERERRVGEESRQVLARDLGEHKRVVAAQAAELGALAAERARLAAELERERREQGAVRAALERQLAEHREVLAAREADLDAHRRVLVEVRAQAEAVRAELSRAEATSARERAEMEAVRATLSQDLDGHRRTLAAVRRVIEEKDSALAALEAEVRRLEALAGEIQGQLVGARERGEALEAELAARRAELGDRWGNLKRALGPKPRE